MIATLACRPLRLGNLIGLEIGRQLQRRDDGWWIEIDAAETKTGEPVSLPFPEVLVPALEAYLQYWRPRLASPGRVAAVEGAVAHRAGSGISPNHAYFRITRHTREAFGQPVNPHLFPTPPPHRRHHPARAGPHRRPAARPSRHRHRPETLQPGQGHPGRNRLGMRCWGRSRGNRAKRRGGEPDKKLSRHQPAPTANVCRRSERKSREAFQDTRRRGRQGDRRRAGSCP